MNTRGKKASHRLVKIHRPYTIDEAFRLTGFSKGTIRRWVKDRRLPALLDQRPFLILGEDLADFLKSRAKPACKMAPHECYCLKCRQPRSPALAMAEYIPHTTTTGNLRALCEVCTTVMNKMIAKRALQSLASRLEVSLRQGEEHLADTADYSLNEHFDKDPESDA